MLRIPEAVQRLLPGRGRAPVALNEKGSRTGALIAFEQLGQPVWSPRDYGHFAREGFMQNAILYRSVRMIAEAAASIPLLVYEGGEELEDHPLIDLLRQPSLDHTSVDFFESWYGFLLVAGNGYVEAVALNGTLRELHILRPDRMKVIPGPDGWPEGYEYTAGGQSIRFMDDAVPGVRPILHTKMFHPANDHYGMSPIEAASVAIDIHNEASKWNKALLDNSARPSGALVYAASNGQMTGEQFQRLKDELETSYQGARHAGRPLLLEGGLDWKPLSLSPKDMDFIEAKNSAAREIALAMGVPPQLLGIPGDSTYSNYAEAQRAFWRATVLPLVNRMARAFGSWLSPAFGSVLEVRPDLDSVEALNPEREALWARLDAASFLTEDEKRVAAGYGASSIAFGDSPSSSRPPNAVTPEAQKYSPDQPRVPAGSSDGGQWTDGGGGGGLLSDGRVQVANAGSALGVRNDANDSIVEQVQQQPMGPTRRVVIGGRPYAVIGEGQQFRLEQSAQRADTAMARVRQGGDLTWQPKPNLTDPNSAEGAIRANLARAQQAEARAQVLERGGIPLGFGGRTDFEVYGRTAWDGLARAGHGDAVPYIRGSAVTGFSYLRGEAFDVGRRSDYDLAIVSPSLLRRAEAFGVEIRGRGSRTDVLDPKQSEALGLGQVLRDLGIQTGRDASFVIFRSREDLELRGPNIPLP